MWGEHFSFPLSFNIRNRWSESYASRPQEVFIKINSDSSSKIKRKYQRYLTIKLSNTNCFIIRGKFIL